MLHSTGQQHLQSGMGNGSRLERLRPLMMFQLERLLQSESKWQNHLVFLNSVQGSDMKEVHDLASGMKDAIAMLRKVNVAAKEALASEMQRSVVNAQKVKSMAQDLKVANLEVEAFLGESRSNFPTSEDLNTHQTDGLKVEQPKTDHNGVTLNSETTI